MVMNQPLSRETKCQNCRFYEGDEASVAGECHLEPSTRCVRRDNWCSHFQLTDAAQNEQFREAVERILESSRLASERNPAAEPNKREWWRFWE